MTTTAISTAEETSRAKGDKLVLAHVYTSTLVLGLGALFGMLQGLSRANFIAMPDWFDYYRMLTAHGVLMALVFTTFFICGFLTYATYKTIPRVRTHRVGWLGYFIMLIGTVMAAVTILSGDASVLYTFYAPMKASPFFYLGATLLVAGTWFTSWDIVSNAIWYKRQNPKLNTPLPAYMASITMIMWCIATIGVTLEMLILIPWSLGWTPGVDVELTRMLLWYFGHPLVYFWIMGAYTIWYTVIPARYGGTVFSDALSRLAFLMLLLLSTPVGIHHQYLDPGISAGWKWLHGAITYGVAMPSLLTAFALFASFEMAARKAKVHGFVNTLKRLPWNDPVFAGSGLGMVLFIFGGFGGIVNASYSMDTIVHNTMWVVGHFHITVGGPVAMTFVGASYLLIPSLTGRKLFAPKLALASIWLWFLGMVVMSTSMHWAGLLGAPRRTSDVSYFGAQGAATWHPEMVGAALGGMVIALSVLFFVIVATGTFLTNKQDDPKAEFTFAPVDDRALETPQIFDRFGSWAGVALAIAILAYAGPMYQLIQAHAYLAPGMRTW